MEEREFSRFISAVEPSQTLAISSKAKALKAKGKDVIGFGAGEPDFDTPENVKRAAKRAIDEGFTKYTPPAGTEELRLAIAAKLERDNGLRYIPENIVVCCGAKHALYNAVRVLCNPGDEFIIIAPYWVTYPAQVIMAGGTPMFVRTEQREGYRLDRERLRAAVSKRTRAIIINSPSNPTGWVAGHDDLEAIAEIALSHDLTIISDEIYEKIIYPPHTSVSVVSVSEEVKERTIVINGLSKSHSMTGWRIGYLAASREIASLASRLQSHCTSNPCSISQAAACEALKGDQSFVTMMREEFRIRRDYIVKRLQAMSKVTCDLPKGAFYVFPDISGVGLGSVDFSERLLAEELVAVVPGSAFGNDRHVRLSYATSMENITRGMDRVEAFVTRLA